MRNIILTVNFVRSGLFPTGHVSLTWEHRVFLPSAEGSSVCHGSSPARDSRPSEGAHPCLQRGSPAPAASAGSSPGSPRAAPVHQNLAYPGDCGTGPRPGLHFGPTLLRRGASVVRPSENRGHPGRAHRPRPGHNTRRNAALPERPCRGRAPAGAYQAWYCVDAHRIPPPRHVVRLRRSPRRCPFLPGRRCARAASAEAIR